MWVNPPLQPQPDSSSSAGWDDPASTRTRASGSSPCSSAEEPALARYVWTVSDTEFGRDASRRYPAIKPCRRDRSGCLTTSSPAGDAPRTGAPSRVCPSCSHATTGTRRCCTGLTGIRQLGDPGVQLGLSQLGHVAARLAGTGHRVTVRRGHPMPRRGVGERDARGDVLGPGRLAAAEGTAALAALRVTGWLLRSARRRSGGTGGSGARSRSG